MYVRYFISISQWIGKFNRFFSKTFQKYFKYAEFLELILTKYGQMWKIR